MIILVCNKYRRTISFKLKDTMDESSDKSASVQRFMNLQAYVVEREYDLAYLKLTVIVILLIIIIYYMTCKFNAEMFTPYAGIQKNNIFRSDPAFDRSPSNY